MYWSYSLKMKHYKNTRSCLCILALFLINLIEMSQILVTSTYKGIIRYQTYHLFWVISDTCTLSNSFAIPWLHVAYQAPLSMGFFRKEYWSRLSFPPPGDLPHPVIKLTTSVSPELAGRFFTHWATSEALSATSVQFSSVTQSCLTLCDPVDCSMLCNPACRILCPPSPGACLNSCALSWWCRPTILSSVVPFSSCLQSFPALGPFLMSQIFASGGQSIGVSASASVLPINVQDWFPLGLTDLISLQSKGLSREFSNTIVQKHQFFSAQASSQSNSHIHTWPQEKP